MTWTVSGVNGMAFTTVAPQAQSYTTSATAAVTYRVPATSAATYIDAAFSVNTYVLWDNRICPPVWAQVTSILTKGDGGVDFRLVATDSYPMLACEERYIGAVEETHGEGAP